MATNDIHQMLKENKARHIALFPDYDPITGKGAPGERRVMVIEDLMMGEPAEWYVPIEMYESEKFVHIISDTRSTACTSIRRQ